MLWRYLILRTKHLWLQKHFGLRTLKKKVHYWTQNGMSDENNVLYILGNLKGFLIRCKSRNYFRLGINHEEKLEKCLEPINNILRQLKVGVQTVEGFVLPTKMVPCSGERWLDYETVQSFCIETQLSRIVTYWLSTLSPIFPSGLYQT